MTPPVTHGRLIAHGRLPWVQVLDLLSDCTCVWADLDDLHRDPAPEKAPLSTHLWAWHENRHLRVRLDGVEGIVAELVLGTDGEEQVRIQTSALRSWLKDEGRVSSKANWRDRGIVRHDVVGVTPLSFMSME